MPPPPITLLDHSFLVPLHDADHPWHSDAREHYRELVERYRLGTSRLVVTDHDLARLAHAHGADQPSAATPTVPFGWVSALLAPATVHYVAGTEHSAARRLVASTADIEPWFAVQLVVLQRNRIRHVASYDQRLAAHGFTVLTAPTTADGAPATTPDGHVAYDGEAPPTLLSN